MTPEEHHKWEELLQRLTAFVAFSTNVRLMQFSESGKAQTICLYREREIDPLLAELGYPKKED